MILMRLPVYISTTSLPEAGLWEMIPHLTQLEYQRLDGMKSTQAQQRFIAGRLLIKKTLVEIYGSTAQEWTLSADAGPIKVSGMGVPKVSLTHSHDLIACAVAAVPVGLDIEYRQPRDFKMLAHHICSKTEWEWFTSQPESAHGDAFYSLWTKKESLFKLLGGYPYPDSSNIPPAVQCLDIDIGKGYAGALAVEADGKFSVVCMSCGVGGEACGAKCSTAVGLQVTAPSGGI